MAAVSNGATRTRVWLVGCAAVAMVMALSGCPMESQSKNADLPRFTELPAFDPHRKSFECKAEAAANPPISERAQEVFEQAQARDDWRLTVENVSEEGRAKIAADMARIYGEAMKLGHWKAQYNLATNHVPGRLWRAAQWGRGTATD